VSYRHRFRWFRFGFGDDFARFHGRFRHGFAWFRVMVSVWFRERMRNRGSARPVLAALAG
jgi:hypothetical protein